jgi:hypothetical protein
MCARSATVHFMRCYNAAMNERLQFSMRALFWAVSFCCLGAWFLVKLHRFYEDLFGFYLAFVAAGAIASSAIGSRFGRPWAGPLIVIGLASVLFGLLLIAAGPGILPLVPALTDNHLGKNNDALAVILIVAGALLMASGIHRART